MPALVFLRVLFGMNKFLTYVCRLFDLPRTVGCAVSALACLLAMLCAFAVSMGDVARYPGVDNRTRIVGARIMASGGNPYFYKQNVSTPATLLDPVLDTPYVSRCTNPPSLLAMFIPLSHLDYRLGRQVWAVTEWLLLFISFLLIVRAMPEKFRLAGLAAGTLFFACGYFWRLHVERGQYYVVILFLWSAASYAFARRGDNALSGIALGLAAAFRPSVVAALLLPPLLRLKKTAVFSLCTAAAAAGLSAAVFGPRLWKDYVRSSEIWERTIADPLAFELEQKMPFAKSVEGYPVVALMPSHTTSVTVLHAIGGSVALSGVRKLRLVRFMYLAFLVLMLMLFYRLRTVLPQSELLLPVLTLAVLTDYFVPTRYGYADVLLLAPVLLVGARAAERFRPALYLMFAGLAAGAVFGYGVYGAQATVWRNALVAAGLLGYYLSALRGR